MEKIYKILQNNILTSSTENILESLCITFILISIIFFTYKIVYRSDDYKIKFNICLSIIILVTTMIITLIKNNLNISLGLLGIISIIRFRVKLNDFRDVGFILWGIGSGIAIGTGNYLIGFTYTIVIAIYFIFLNTRTYKVDLFQTLIIRSSCLDEKKLEEILSKYCVSYKKIAIEKKESYLEYIYTIQSKKQVKLKEKITSKLNISFIKFI
ncbi:DUF4956 domain-containing protein [Cetobacterium sp.]|uniref:DUF4956 domain-containing protein n=1 Tax=Cetobacterium sp. TaxID=2071632 RepID=UPI003F375265